MVGNGISEPSTVMSRQSISMNLLTSSLEYIPALQYMKVTGWLHFASRSVPARRGVNNTRLGGLKEMATVQQVISLEKMTEDTEAETWFHPKKCHL